MAQQISEEAIQFLFAYKEEIAAWRMQKPQWEGDWWTAHDSDRHRDATYEEGRTAKFQLERFKDEESCVRYVQLVAVDKALSVIRANAS